MCIRDRPYLSGEKDWDWVCDVVNKVLEGCPVATSWHFCPGNAWGNELVGMTGGGYGSVLSHYHGVNVQQFVIEFASRELLRYIEPERVTLTTDCGMKQLPRVCAREKLKSLVRGADIVRRELR